MLRNLSSNNPVLLVQLGVPTDVDDTKLKKAYRKAAMQVRAWILF